MRPVDKMKPVRDGRYADTANFQDSYFSQKTKDSFAEALRLEVYVQARAMFPHGLIDKMPQSFPPLANQYLALQADIALRLAKANPTFNYQAVTASRQQKLSQMNAFVGHVPGAEAIRIANATLADLLNWLNREHPEASLYTDSRERMIPEIGAYCSFCERPIKAKLDVEHMAPKSIQGDERFRWRNFLLACGNCNTAKSDRYRVFLTDGTGTKWHETVPLTYCFWPDRIANAFDTAAAALHRAGPHAQDSFNVFQYEEFGVLRIHPNVNRLDGTYDRVLATMAIVDLDIQPNQGRSPVSGLAYVAWDGRNNAQTQETPQAWDHLAVSGVAPPRLMTNVGPTGVVPLLRLSRNLANASVIYQDFKSAVGDAKDYRAFHRNEAWQIAERFRRKFDRILPGNQKMKDQWKVTADKLATERAALAIERTAFDLRYTQYETDKKAIDDDYLLTTQRYVQYRQEIDNAPTADEQQRLGAEALQFYNQHEYEHAERARQSAQVLSDLGSDNTILEKSQEELDEMEQDNDKSWNTYIRKDQGFTEAQWQHHIGQMTNFACQQAEAQGHWSVWVTVFKARAPDDSFHVRPAVIPVLRKLLTFVGTVAADQFNPPLYTEGAWNPALAPQAQSDLAVWMKSQEVKHDQSASERAEEEARRRQEQDKDLELQRLRLELAQEKRENERLRRELSARNRNRDMQRARAHQRQRLDGDNSMDEDEAPQGHKRLHD